MDRLTQKVDDLSVRGDQLAREMEVCASRTEAVEDQLRVSRQLLHGFGVLRAVALQEEFPLGRALRRVLAMRLVERLKACPARPPAGDRAVSGRARQEQTAVSLDVPFPRAGVDELVAMLSLSVTPRAGRKTARPSRVVHFPGAAALLGALGLPVAADYMCRVFKRKDGSRPARPLLERVTSDEGTQFYIIGRDEASDDVSVAVRESESFHVRRRAFVHGLNEKVVSRDSLPAVPARCPAFIAWQESIVSASFDEWEGGDACGTVTLSVPCCSLEVLPGDVADLTKTTRTQ